MFNFVFVTVGLPIVEKRLVILKIMCLMFHENKIFHAKVELHAKKYCRLHEQEPGCIYYG